VLEPGSPLHPMPPVLATSESKQTALIPSVASTSHTQPLGHVSMQDVPPPMYSSSPSHECPPPASCRRRRGVPALSAPSAGAGSGSSGLSGIDRMIGGDGDDVSRLLVVRCGAAEARGGVSLRIGASSGAAGRGCGIYAASCSRGGGGASASGHTAATRSARPPARRGRARSAISAKLLQLPIC
jgi:hypothetical protein